MSCLLYVCGCAEDGLGTGVGRREHRLHPEDVCQIVATWRSDALYPACTTSTPKLFKCVPLGIKVRLYGKICWIPIWILSLRHTEHHRQSYSYFPKYGSVSSTDIEMLRLRCVHCCTHSTYFIDIIICSDNVVHDVFYCHPHKMY